MKMFLQHFDRFGFSLINAVHLVPYTSEQVKSRCLLLSFEGKRKRKAAGLLDLSTPIFSSNYSIFCEIHESGFHLNQLINEKKSRQNF